MSPLLAKYKSPMHLLVIASLIWTLNCGDAPSIAASIDQASAGSPGILATVPVDLDPAYPKNKDVLIAFNRDMDPLSVETNISVSPAPTAPAVLSVIYSSTAKSAVLSFPKTKNTTYTITVPGTIIDTTGVSIGQNTIFSFTAGNIDNKAANIILKIPMTATLNVPVTTSITASFDDDMNPLSIVPAGQSTSTSFTVNEFDPLTGALGAVVPGDYYYITIAKSLMFFPAQALLNNKTYKVSLTNVLTDLAGNASAPLSWTFTTKPDTTPPAIISSNPMSGSTGVSNNSAVNIQFSEPMNALTMCNGVSLNATGVSFMTPDNTGIAVSATCSYDTVTNSLIVTPLLLGNQTMYTLYLTSAVTDANGVALVPYSLSFTTSSSSDTVQPFITSVQPTTGATNVALNSNIQINFSETINTASLNGAVSLVQTNSGTPVAGLLLYDGSTNSGLFMPSQNLLASTNYTLNIIGTISDSAGNLLVSGQSSTFTTGLQIDATAPTILTTIPAAGSMGFPDTASIQAVFSEDISSSTMNNSHFTLSDGATTVTGSVTYDAATRTASFLPTLPLNHGSIYTATISSMVTDPTGNRLAQDFSWSFSSGSLTNTNPFIVAVSPPDNSINVPITTTLTQVAFNSSLSTVLTTSSFVIDAYNIATNTTTHFSPVSVNYSPALKTAEIILPQLTSNTLYHVNLLGPVTDSTGAISTTGFSWNFTTETVPHQINVVINGLAGNLVLQNNGADNLIIPPGSTTAVFNTTLIDMSAYSITVLNQPFGQTCSILNSTGIVNSSDVTVNVNCIINTYTVSGSVTGLAPGNYITLSDGTNPVVTLTDVNPTYSFSYLDGTNYIISVANQPLSPMQMCTGMVPTSGLVSGSNITGADFNCITQQFSVSGVITGLAGSNLQLSLNNIETIIINPVATVFSFLTNITDSSSYIVVVATQPQNVNQTCIITGAAGIIQGGNASVSINCTTNQYKVGGVLTGLAPGNNFVIDNNGIDPLVLSSNGTFYFNSLISDGAGYMVSISAQPLVPPQQCSITAANGSGLIAGADINNINIDCKNYYSISGNIINLYGSITLRNNGIDDLAFSGNGGNFPFTFYTPLPDFSVYNISYIPLKNKTGIIVNCTITNGNGVLNGADVSNIVIDCAPQVYTISGNISGLKSTGLIVELTYGDMYTGAVYWEQLSININGAYTFNSLIPDQSTYLINFVQPKGQFCSVNNPNFTKAIITSNLIDMNISCIDNTYTVSGSVTGLTPGNYVTLQDRYSGQTITVTDMAPNYSFTYTDGALYKIVVLIQPVSPNQTCNAAGVTNGTINGANIFWVDFVCTTQQYMVNAIVTGLNGTGLQVNLNNTETITLTNGTTMFNFNTLLFEGSPYFVSVLTQPSSLNQTCTITNNFGIVNGAAIIVSIDCITNKYNIDVAVNGMTGSGLNILYNNTTSYTYNANGVYNIGQLTGGTSYTLDVRQNPFAPDNRCLFYNGAIELGYTISGTVSTDMIIDINCSGSVIASVSNLSAQIVSMSQIDLTWNNPADSYYAGTLVLKKEGSSVTGPFDPNATVVCSGLNSQCTALVNGQKMNYFSVYTYDQILTYSMPSEIKRSTTIGNFWDFPVAGTPGNLFPQDTSYLADAIWTGTEYIAVGQRYYASSNTAEAAIIKSSDNLHWTEITIPLGAASFLEDIAWSGSRFVAVGIDSASKGAIIASNDGAVWNIVYSTINNTSLTGVVWSGTMFIAIGFDLIAGNAIIITSNDGITWVTQNSPVINNATSIYFTSIEYSGMQSVIAGQYFDTSLNMWQSLILTSSDGANWLQQSLNINDYNFVNSIKWTGFQYVAVGQVRDAITLTYNALIATSADGVTWSFQSLNSGPITQLNDIVWAGGQYIAVGSTNNQPLLIKSNDGINWTVDTSLFDASYNISLDSIIWTGTTYMVTGYINSNRFSNVFGGAVYSSTNGMTWSVQKSLNNFSPNNFNGIANNGNMYISVSGFYKGWNSLIEKRIGIQPFGGIMQSTDGVLWMPISGSSIYYLNDIIWVNNQFIAVGDSGTILLSSNGVTWSNIIPNDPNYLAYRFTSIIWTGSNYMVTGIADNMGTDFIMTSSDGLNWSTQILLSSSQLNEASFNGSRYVLVGSNSNVLSKIPLSNLVTSSDGINWSYNNIPNIDFYSVVWSGTMFIAVGYDKLNMTSAIFSSNDGVSWSQQNAGIGNNQLRSIIWDGSQFIAAGGTDTSLGVVLTSPDGITWGSQNLPINTSTLNNLLLDRDTVWAVGEKGTAIISQ